MATATVERKRKYGELQDGAGENFITPDNNSGKHHQQGSKYRKSRHLQTRTQPLLHEDGRGPAKEATTSQYISIQIVTGAYDRGILHGITASIPSHTLEPSPTKPTQPETNGGATDDILRNGDAKFSDSFLFGAHSSSIRCLAISGSAGSQKRILATGGSDERINLYTLSAHASLRPETSHDAVNNPLISAENVKNRSLGNLLHHERAITRLQFPPNSNKLFSSSEDNNVAITRTRDWTLLSSIRAPIPKPIGRPSGDTAGPGEVPAGINDFAIHPSQKLMLSLGRGERCLRLWNLMTGKKAGVLSFERDVLAQVGEGKYSSGEGRRVLWSENGEVYVVVFERGAVVYGVDSKARAVIKPSPSTKLHQARILPKLPHSGREVLAISTEDGRVLFFDIAGPSNDARNDKDGLLSCFFIAQLGGRAAGVSGRIKDFEILKIPQPIENLNLRPSLLVVTANSDGTVRIWTMSSHDLETAEDSKAALNGNGHNVSNPKQCGRLVGVAETGNRITCLGAFLMDAKPAGEVQSAMSHEVNGDGIGPGDDESEGESWDGIDGE